MLRKATLAILLSCLPVIIMSQQFKYESKIEVTDSTGFYRIMLPSAAVAQMNHDLSDLRIVNSKGAEVPYIVEGSQIQQNKSTFIPFNILKHEILKDSATILVIDNKEQKRINNLSLIISNADVEKGIRLTGSNDQKIWFSVRENAFFHSINNPGDVTEIKLLNFPQSNYRYFRIEIDDKHSSPINILKTGIYEMESNSTKPEMSTIVSTVTVADSLKQKCTWVNIRFDQLQIIDELNIEILEPPFYLRDVDVYYSDRDSSNITRHYLMQAIFNSKDPIKLFTGGIRCKSITLVINNKDNQSLKIKAIMALYQNHYCLASLEKNETHILRFGNLQSSIPEYDIKYFRDKLPENPPILKTAGVTPIAKQPESKPSIPFFQDSRFIWAALIIVIAMLGYFTVTLLKEKK